VAHRLNRALGVAVLVSLVACWTNPKYPSYDASGASALAASMADVTRSFGQYYRVENHAVTAAYVERSRANGRSAGRSEPCLLPDGSVSRRPSVVANPPLSEAAIRQREDSVAAIESYLDALVAFTDDSAPDMGSGRIADLRDRAADLQRAARNHDRGDLFIEDTASALGRAVKKLNDGSAGPSLVPAFEAVDTPLRKLISIMTADAERQRADTVDATTLAYEVWREQLRRMPSQGPSAPPFCSEPAIFRRPGPIAAKRPAEARGARLWSTMAAARDADPEPVLRAMASLDDAEMRLLTAPPDSEAAGRAVIARARLEQAARAFVRAAVTSP